MAVESSEMRKTLTKVSALVRRAQSPTGDDDEEARTAAMQAANMMREYELVLISKSEIERINERLRTAEKAAKESKDERMKNIIIGAIGGMVLGGKGGLKL